MKKIMIGICCLALFAIMVSAYSASNAVQSPPPADTLDPSEISLAAEMSIEALTVQSDFIAVGNCLNTQSQWVDRSLVTVANISVQEVLKGDSTSNVTVVLPGGVDMNRKIPIAMTYPGAPRIEPSEKVLLFLTRDDAVGGGYAVTGFSQGKFSIVENEEGQEFVSRDLTRTALQSKGGIKRGTVSQSPLANLKTQILRQVHKQ
jgi:hypothetical protein